MAAGKPPAPRAAAAPGPESAAEAEHLLSLAESELSAGRLRAARRHALRASRLYPSCPRASAVATAANVLLADASSHHASLLLPEPDDPDASPLSASELRRHFKSLVKSLRVCPDYAAAYPSSAAAEEALGRATEAYEALTAPPPGTFWTACAGCRLLHEFERKYVGYRLICPSCRRTFLAVEVPPPPEAEPPALAPAPAPRRPAAAKKPNTEKLEMTLAEMQLQLAKKRRGAKASESSSRDLVVVDEDDDDEEEQEDGEEAEAENNHSDLMAVEDSDFYNFDANRGERCFKRGQLWALYADADGMPRQYALVDGVQRGTQFRVQIRWLDGEEGKPCGQFKVGRAETVHSVNVFSHLLACERAAREVYQVYPRKASVWALHGGEEGDAARTKYDIVVMLSGYDERYGASFGYLEKVEGFRSIFTRRDIGSHAVHFLQKDDLGVLSHQIPARKVPKGEGSTLPPGDCWELDPASLPPELLHIEAVKPRK
ncbi:unnamed protein product [Miscanthus lutarioriparius]|uniref:DUF3444 domain-containing protein n=1 Tax=Miscanthus lutarioriparius TaxID=422564 RepID=A0A811QWY4_9POAL|nr:unnamed protein product [Miscanthus lutarioriparius]